MTAGPVEPTRSPTYGEVLGAATAPLDATPKGVVTVANLTMIGVGTSGGANTAVNIRDNVEAKLYNSVFVNFAKGLDIESLPVGSRLAIGDTVVV